MDPEGKVGGPGGGPQKPRPPEKKKKSSELVTLVAKRRAGAWKNGGQFGLDDLPGALKASLAEPGVASLVK